MIIKGLDKIKKGKQRRRIAKSLLNFLILIATIHDINCSTTDFDMLLSLIDVCLFTHLFYHHQLFD